jgi:hypothetical protein
MNLSLPASISFQEMEEQENTRKYKGLAPRFAGEGLGRGQILGDRTHVKDGHCPSYIGGATLVA